MLTNAKGQLTCAKFTHTFLALCCCIQFIHEEALACELAAYFYLELEDINKSVEYFLLAHEKYHEWGAVGKCNSLFKFVENTFTPASTDVGHTDTTGNS